MSDSIRIRKAQPADSAVIAALHPRLFPEALLSQLGDRFMRAFYDTLLASGLGFAFVVEQGERPIGFATGVLHWRKFYAALLRSHPRTALLALLRTVARRRSGHLLRTSRYAASTALPPAEFVSMAVDPAVRGKGLGEQLTRAIVEEFSAQGVDRLRVTTSEANTTAARLFEKIGFRFHSFAVMHGGERALVYVITPAAAVRVDAAAPPAG